MFVSIPPASGPIVTVCTETGPHNQCIDGDLHFVRTVQGQRVVIAMYAQGQSLSKARAFWERVPIVLNKIPAWVPQ